MRYLSDEFNFKTSTLSFSYLKSVVDYYKDNIDKANTIQLQRAYQHIADKRNVTYDAVSMGVYRSINTTIEYSTVNSKYPSIQRNLGIKELIVRLAKICIQEGCEF